MISPDSSHGVSRVVRHKDFYLRGGDMTVLVENHLYRIHSYFFERESLFFRNKLNSSTTGDEEERGSTDKNAYTLEGVESEDFARFLWVFYNPKYSVYEAPLETWLSILKLANRWTFDDVKELAVRELEKIEIEAVEKIAIYHDHSISRLYLIPSYIDICKRDKSLSFSEGKKLGMETVLRIAEARERLRQQASESCIRSPTFEDFEDDQVEELVRKIFCLGTRPTSPSPASPANGVNGVNGTIKLNPAPSGNPPKANGAPAPRANGVSAADHKPGSSVNSIPSIAFTLAQASEPPTQTAQQQQTGAQQTAPQGQRPSVLPVIAGPAASPSQPPPPPPAADKPKDKDNKETAPQTPSSATVMSPKTGGVGEPLSSVDLSQGAGSRDDVSVSKSPVVPSNEHSNDVTAESNDNVNDAEKGELGKDNDTASVASDVEGGKGAGRGRKNKNKGNGGVANRGRKG